MSTISVVVTTYNRAHLLPRAIKSIRDELRYPNLKRTIPPDTIGQASSPKDSPKKQTKQLSLIGHGLK
jgi:hypothetical protein